LSTNHLAKRAQHWCSGRQIRPPLLLSASPSSVVTSGPAKADSELIIHIYCGLEDTPSAKTRVGNKCYGQSIRWAKDIESPLRH
jgi:hypothetical protein